jgi:hypothetical protein
LEPPTTDCWIAIEPNRPLRLSFTKPRSTNDDWDGYFAKPDEWFEVGKPLDDNLPADSVAVRCLKAWQATDINDFDLNWVPNAPIADEAIGDAGENEE